MSTVFHRFFSVGTQLYEIAPSAESWAAANAAAQLRGGYLARIESKSENDALYARVVQESYSYPTAADGGGARYVWLGGTDAATEGTWLWSNGQSLGSYTNWGSGALGTEPDDYGSGQDALALGITVWPQPSGGLGVPGQWNDISATNTLYSLVEWDQQVLQGGAGRDTKTYRLDFPLYDINVGVDGTVVVTSKNTIDNDTVVNDKLIGYERIEFADLSIAVDLNGNAGTVAKILGAVFGKSSVSNKSYVKIGLDLLDSGMSYSALGSLALNAAGLTTNDQIVSTLWYNVVGTVASAQDKAPYIQMLANGTNPGVLVQFAADTSYNKANIDLVGLAKTGLGYV